mgnify:CR=1 FL=1
MNGRPSLLLLLPLACAIPTIANGQSTADYCADQAEPDFDNPGDGWMLCRGEDWWLPSTAVLPSTAGHVSTYSTTVWDHLVGRDNEVPGSHDTDGNGFDVGFDCVEDDGKPCANPYTRNLSAETPNTYLHSLVESDGSTLVLGSGTKNTLARQLYRLNEVDCIRYCQEQKEIYASTPSNPSPLEGLSAFLQEGVDWSSITCSEPADPGHPAEDNNVEGSQYTYLQCTEDARALFPKRTHNIMTHLTETGTGLVGTSGEDLEDLGVLDWGSTAANACDPTVFNCSYFDAAFQSKHASTMDITDPQAYQYLADGLEAVWIEIQDHDLYQHFGSFQVNGESGAYWQYHDGGIIQIDSMSDGTELATFQNLVTMHEPIWSGTTIPRENLMVNLGIGGAEYDHWAAVAESEGMGAAIHGPLHLFNYRLLQHLNHVSYDEQRQAFVADNGHSFAFLHSDLENLDHTDDTFGQYRLFRLSALAALSFRFDRLLVSAYTLPSEGNAQHIEVAGSPVCTGDNQVRCENYDHSEIEDEGALQFLHWMTRTVGLEGQSAHDAWCVPVHLGNNGNGDTFDDRAQQAVEDDPTRRFRTSHPDVYRPVQTFFGSNCKMSVDENLRGDPGMALDSSWTGDAELNSGNGTDDPALTGEAAGAGTAYEGRSLEVGGMMAFEFDQTFWSKFSETSRAAVKIVFVPHDGAEIGPSGSGSQNFRIVIGEYEATVELDSHDIATTHDSSGTLTDSGIHTLTVLAENLDEGQSPNVTLEIDAGVSIDVLAVRVVPVPMP